MNQRLRFGIAAIVALAAAWAGAQVYLSRFAAPAERSVPVPVCETSIATGRDAADGADTAALPPLKIPEKLPDFKLADLDGRTTSVARWQGRRRRRSPCPATH